MRSRSSYTSSEQGVVLVLVAIFLGVLLLLLALAVGLGFVTTQSERLQTVANTASLAALDFYVSNPIPNEADRRIAAVTLANEVLSRNNLKGTEFDLGNVSASAGQGEGGTLFFGRYFRSQPPPGVSTDCVDFPCFDQVEDGVNASSVLLRLRNQSDNPLSAPFAGIVSDNRFFLSSSTATVLVNTCMAHLLDVSFSTITGSNSQPASFCGSGSNCCADADPTATACAVDNPPFGVTFTPDPSLGNYFQIDAPLTTTGVEQRKYSTASAFALNANMIFNTPAGGVISFPQYLESARSPDLLYWMNMPDERADFVGDASALTFKSDYVLRRVHGALTNPDPALPEYAAINLNPAARPRPLTEFMLAANTTLRIINQLPSEANRALFWAFNGNTFGRRFPQSEVLGQRLSTNLAFLTQLTNMEGTPGFAGAKPGFIGTSRETFFDPNIGGAYAIEPRHPTLLDYGFFPSANLPQDSTINPALAATNHSLVMFEAANVLASECGQEGRRLLLLYTDMVPTCRYIPASLGGTEVQANCSPTRDSESGGVSDLWANYKISEYFIKELLIPNLQTQGIAVSVFLDGPSVRSPVANVWKDGLTVADREACINGVDGTFPGPEDCFQSFADLSKAGFRGLNTPTAVAGGGPPDQAELNVGLRPCASFGGRSTFNCQQNPAEHRDAYLNLNSGESVIFERSAPLAYDLATLTGGLFCPLREVGDVNNYRDHDGDCDGEVDCCLRIFNQEPGFQGKTPCVYKNELRNPDLIGNEYLEFSEIFAPKGVQAAQCARRIATANPYIQEVPLQICPQGQPCCNALDGCL